MSKFEILFQYSSKLILEIFMTSSLLYNIENGVNGVCLIISQKKNVRHKTHNALFLNKTKFPANSSN